MRRLSFLALAGCLACSKAPPADTPDAAYAHFVHDVERARAGEDVALLDDFDASTRATLTARAAAAAQATGNRLPADPVVQLLQGPPPSPPVAIQIVEQSGEHATLAVQVDAGTSGKVAMVREAGRWRVHLELEADGGQ